MPPSGIIEMGVAPAAVLINDSITDGAAGDPSQFTNQFTPPGRRQVQELPVSGASSREAQTKRSDLGGLESEESRGRIPLVLDNLNIFY